MPIDFRSLQAREACALPIVFTLPPLLTSPAWSQAGRELLFWRRGY